MLVSSNFTNQFLVFLVRIFQAQEKKIFLLNSKKLAIKVLVISTSLLASINRIDKKKYVMRQRCRCLHRVDDFVLRCIRVHCITFTIAIRQKCDKMVIN